MYNKLNEIIKYFDYKNIAIPAGVISIIESSTDNFFKVITRYVSSSITNILEMFTKIPVFAIYVVITMLATYFICTDKFYILDQLEHHFPRMWVKKMNNKIKKIISSLGNYLKAEMILVFITFIIVLIGLYIFKIIGFPLEFPLLIAIGIGFVDALPILRIWNGISTMGNMFWAKWQFKLWNIVNHFICNYINHKAINRAKDCKQ